MHARQVSACAEQNKLLLENKENSMAYVDNTLTSLVIGVKVHPAILA
jgi:hypothetical protein